LNQAKREQEDSGSNLSAIERSVVWTVYFRSFAVYWAESRALQYFENCFSFVKAVGILFYPYYFIILSFIIYFPSVLSIYTSYLVFIGKFLYIHDEDFSVIGINFKKSSLIIQNHFDSFKNKDDMIWGKDEDSSQYQEDVNIPSSTTITPGTGANNGADGDIECSVFDYCTTPQVKSNMSVGSPDSTIAADSTISHFLIECKAWLFLIREICLAADHTIRD
jgi:hypothetical protein